MGLYGDDEKENGNYYIVIYLVPAAHTTQWSEICNYGLGQGKGKIERVKRNPDSGAKQPIEAKGDICQADWRGSLLHIARLNARRRGAQAQQHGLRRRVHAIREHEGGPRLRNQQKRISRFRSWLSPPVAKGNHELR